MCIQFYICYKYFIEKCFRAFNINNFQIKEKLKMAIREVSASQILSRNGQSNVQLLYKFNFSDYHLAHQVHAYIKKKLIQFDINNNGKFEQKQIRQALITVLNQDEQELQYVVMNVFRYDRDNDGAVTYQQFIKFCTEQHFGEMAIQRLHRKNLFQNGHRRILNKRQFVTTLQFAFGNLNYDVHDLELQRLFYEVDLDRDGYISYEDYFNFLREYFGRGSADPANQDRQPVINDQSYRRSLKRIGKLIFPQIRTLMIQQDTRKAMSMSPDEVRTFISSNFTFSTHSPTKQLIESFTLPWFPSNKGEATYEQSLKIVIQCVFNPNTDNNNFSSSHNYATSSKPLSNEQFVQRFFQNELNVIRVRPARYMMDQIYDYFRKTSKSEGVTEKNYSQFLRDISEVFRPQNRGLV